MPQHTFPAYPSQIETWKRAAARFAAQNYLPIRRGPSGVFSGWIRLVLNAAADGLIAVTYTSRQIQRGRPRLDDGEPDETLGLVQIRATEAEINNWAESSTLEGLECAEWERQSLTWATDHDTSLVAKVG